MLFHGIAKLQSGVGFIMGMLGEVGLPPLIAYGVYVGQIVAPIMLIVGFRVKIAAGLIIFTMLGAIGLAHGGDIFSLSKFGGWAIEIQMFYVMAATAIFLQGGGKYSIDAFLKK